MAIEYLHIDYEPPSRGWLLRIMKRLNESSSSTLRERMSTWGSSHLKEMGFALTTKLAMLSRVLCRVDQQLQRLGEQLNDEALIDKCIRRGAAYKITDKALPYELLTDIDSFLFESRSAYEIIGHFLCQFFDHILKRRINEAQLKKLLDARNVDTRWIEELKCDRILFFHNTTPWLALEFVSRKPLRFELLILKKNVNDFTNPDDYIRFEQLRAIYHGIESSLNALHKWVLEQIEEFETLEGAER